MLNLVNGNFIACTIDKNYCILSMDIEGHPLNIRLPITEIHTLISGVSKSLSDSYLHQCIALKGI